MALTPVNETSAERTRRWKYGITREEYKTMYAKQGGRCAICGKVTPLDVDHCHSSTKVRGLLCRTCNAGLGSFHDSQDLLKKASDYLTGVAQRFRRPGSLYLVGDIWSVRWREKEKRYGYLVKRGRVVRRSKVLGSFPTREAAMEYWQNYCFVSSTK